MGASGLMVSTSEFDPEIRERFPAGKKYTFTFQF